MAEDVVLSSDVQIRLFKAGALQAAVDVTSFTKSQQSEARQRKLLGSREQPVYIVYLGYSGTLAIERTGKVTDDLLDALETQYFNGEPVDEVQIVEMLKFPDGSRRTYIYGACVIWGDESQSGDAAAAITLNWKTGKKRQKA
jgi:hypothetical protein